MKVLLTILTILTLTSCSTWQKVLYGSDPCGQPWQMESVKGKREPKLGH